MLNVLLCDDEALAISRLKSLIGRSGGVSVVGEAANGPEAIAKTIELKPDLVLLDIEMPELDGFDVVEQLGRDPSIVPLIVYVTAYPNFAVQAFDTGAVDFLTKPVRIGRLEMAFDRARQALADRSAAARLAQLSEQLEGLRSAYRSERGDGNFIWVRRRTGNVRVDLDRVDWVQAEGEYVRLHCGEANFLHRDSITAIAARLDPARFLRVHRSYIINRRHVVSVTRRTTGSYWLSTATGLQLPVGKSYRRLAREMIRPAR